MAIICLIVFFSGREYSSAQEIPKRKIILGTSTIMVQQGSMIGAQVDRVIRDIAWTGSKFDQRKNPFEIIFDKENLVPYMEGRLIGQLMDDAQIRVVGLTPVIARKQGVDYYARDASGKFDLRVDPSKLDYLTVYRVDEQAVEIVDTHGFNMLVGPFLKLRNYFKIDLIVACMDIPSKAQAALQLARFGINCYGPCDRFASDLLGYKRNNDVKSTIIGTAPIRRGINGAFIGGQPVAIWENEQVIVQTTDKPYPDQYCDTASRYFKRLVPMYEFSLRLVEVSASVGETAKLVKEAEKRKAEVIGARVYNEADAMPLVEWLGRNKNHRLILFHSAPYEPGYKLFFKFPSQTSFGDLDPIVVAQ